MRVLPLLEQMPTTPTISALPVPKPVSTDKIVVPEMTAVEPVADLPVPTKTASPTVTEPKSDEPKESGEEGEDFTVLPTVDI